MPDIKLPDGKKIPFSKEINGFEMYKGHKAEGSYDKEIFKRFDTVMSGHFHHKSDDGQIYYLGTPYELYWNDFGDPKGFHIFDTETRELERIVNPFTILPGNGIELTLVLIFGFISRKSKRSPR